MGMFNEVKCSRCDRHYSGLRSRCPYCGARRIGRGKYSGSSDDSTGKMLITILIMIVLIAAVVVLLVSSRDSTEPEPEVESSAPPSAILPDDSDNTAFEGLPSSPTEVSPPDEIDDPVEPVVTINSVTITYAGAKIAHDEFTMKVSDAPLPLKVKIDPEDVEEKIEWSSSAPGVFDVVATDTTGISVKVTSISAGTGKLTVTVGDVTAECLVRVING